MKFFISIGLIILMNLHFRVNAQVYNVVGCKANQQTLSIGIYDSILVYCAGSETMCGVTINSFGVWNKQNWKTYGNGMKDDFGERINTYAKFNNELILGGTFYLMDSVLVNKIARWNGTEWRALGTGLNAQLNSEKINCLEVYKGELYAAGKFNEINGIKGVNNIARWDGTTWRKVGTGLQGSLPEVYTMEVYNNELYLGGRFIDAGGITAYSIARWNGMEWSSVGLGTNSNVIKLLSDTLRNILYVSGDFDAVNNSIISRKIAIWNGQNWTTMSENKLFGSSVVAMEMYHGYLYAGGYKFSDTCFARWDGNNWEVISGFNGNITNLQTYKNELYVGGSFTMIGTDTIPYLARYYSTDSIWLGINDIRNKTNYIIYPNPTDKIIYIKNQNPSEKKLKLTIRNNLGVIVKEIDFIDKEQIEVEMFDLIPGMYIFSILVNQNSIYSYKICVIDE